LVFIILYFALVVNGRIFGALAKMSKPIRTVIPTASLVIASNLNVTVSDTISFFDYEFVPFTTQLDTNTSGELLFETGIVTIPNLKERLTGAGAHILFTASNAPEVLQALTRVEESVNAALLVQGATLQLPQCLQSFYDKGDRQLLRPIVKNDKAYIKPTQKMEIFNDANQRVPFFDVPDIRFNGGNVQCRFRIQAYKVLLFPHGIYPSAIHYRIHSFQFFAHASPQMLGTLAAQCIAPTEVVPKAKAQRPLRSKKKVEKHVDPILNIQSMDELINYF